MRNNIKNLKSSNIDKYIILIYFIFLADLFFITRINEGAILRSQDIAAALSIPILFYVIKKLSNMLEVKYILITIIVYTLYLVVTNSLFYLSGLIDSRFILYILKEIEYIIAMFIVMYVLIFHRFIAINILNIFLLINIIYGAFQFLTGQISYYGIGSLIGPEPAASGLVYFMCTVIYLILFFEKKKNIYIIPTIISFSLTIFTISKTNILGLSVFFLSFAFLNLIVFILVGYNTIKKKKLLSSSIMMLAASLSTLLWQIKIIKLPVDNLFIERVMARFSRGGSSLSYRMAKSENLYETFNGGSVLRNLFGSGKGVPEFYLKTTTLAVDNQFVRSIIEVGLVGIILWALIIFAIGAFLIKISKWTMNNKNKRYHYVLLFASLNICYMAMGFGYEVFQTTRSGIAFWIITGITLGLNSHLIIKGRNPENINA